MAEIRLDNLVSALASSVAEAEQAVRVHQIRNIHSFFGEDNQPVSVELKLPRASSDGPGESSVVKVPLITLVNLSHMSISELEIKFSTSLGEVSKAPEGGGENVSFAVEDPVERERKTLGWSNEVAPAIDVSTGPATTESGTAAVTLRVRQADTPEGLARIISRLNRTI